MSRPFDVMIAGAGPVGLLLACELSAAGTSVLVLERDANPESPWKDGPLGRRGLNVPSVETFYRRGMMDKLSGSSDHAAQFTKTAGPQFAGHFAGMMLDGNKIDFSRWKYHLPGPAFKPAPIFLGHVEAMLSDRAQRLGAQIMRGMQVTRLSDDGQKVTVYVGDQVFEAPWLVGCDGGRSTVRKEAGFDFVGTDAELIGYAAMCDLDKPELLKRGFCVGKSGMYIVPGPGTIYVIDFDKGFDRSQVVTKEHFQAALRRVSNTDITVEALHMASSFTDRSKQATEYRKGRILLAGDSAHIHSPLGAQGLNAGIGDAMNLGWKLAATVKGLAPPGLLDTYHTERHPVAAWVLEWTRAQVVTLRPDLYGEAISNIMRDMINTEEGTNYFVDRVWGLSQRYDLGDAHPLVGRSAPDFAFDDGTRLGPKLEDGRFLVLDFKNDQVTADFARSMESMVAYSSSGAKETFGLNQLLVRPDGIVAWVAGEGANNTSALRDALSRWVKM